MEFSHAHEMYSHAPQNYSHAQEMYSCYLCPGVFHSQDRLILHIQIMHSSNDKEYLNYPSIAKPSDVSNILEEQYTCDKCQETFTSKAILQKHKNTHRTTKKQFKCDLCSKSYSHKGSLAIHKKKTHIPNSSDHCEQALSVNSSLLNHIEKFPFHCDYCEMRFGTRYALRCHQYLQKHGITFYCDNCNKFYSNSSSLSSHKKRSHPDMTNPPATAFVSVEDVDDDTTNSDDHLDEVSDEDPLQITNDEQDSNETVEIGITAEDPEYDNDNIVEEMCIGVDNEDVAIKRYNDIVYNITVAQAIHYFSR